MSQATICAMARTLARSSASAGNSGGSGWMSSRYSMIASDWVSTSPLESSSAGTRICGLMARNSGVSWRPPSLVKWMDTIS